MNKTMLIGRMTRNPELKQTTAGKEYCQFSLAVNRQFKDKSGEKQVDFINCVVWGQTASNLCKYQSKGNLIYVEGSIQNSSYESNGVKKTATSIFVESIEYLEKKSSEVDNHTIPGSYAEAINRKPEDFMKPTLPPEPTYMNQQYDVHNDDLPF